MAWIEEITLIKRGKIHFNQKYIIQPSNIFPIYIIACRCSKEVRKTKNDSLWSDLGGEVKFH